MALETPTPRHPHLTALTYQYQPVLAVRSGYLPWHEALVRWRLPDGTIRGPLDILPYWLVPVRRATFTRFTLQQAAHTLQLNPRASLSINLSPDQIMDAAAVETLRSLHPSLQERMIIELTEQPIPNAKAYWNALAAIREQCAFVLLDDVTSEDLDHRFRRGAPIDGVKFDRSVLPEMLGGPQQDAALRLLAQARDRFDIIVSEGIEDPTVLGILADLGITHAQGFGVGTPSPDLDALAVAPGRYVPAPADARPENGLQDD